CFVIYTETTDIYTLSLHDALPILACFQALIKKSLPNHNTTGVANAHIISLAYGAFIKNIPYIKTGKDKITAQKVFLFSFLYFLSDRKSTRLNSSHVKISYAVFCLK